MFVGLDLVQTLLLIGPRLSGQRNQQPEAAAAASTRTHAELPAVGLGQLARNGESQAAAAGAALPRRIETMKWPENRFTLLWRNAGTTITHADAQGAVQLATSDQQFAAAMELRVVDQVGNQPVQRHRRQQRVAGMFVESVRLHQRRRGDLEPAHPEQSV